MKDVCKRMAAGLAATGLMMAVLVGCAGEAAPSTTGSEVVSTMAPPAVSSGIVYSNLTDPESQQETVSILQDHGISKEQTDTFLQWVNHLNERATTPLPTGFVPMEEQGIDYRDFLFEPQMLDDGTDYPEENCRLTAFLLGKKNIKTNGKADHIEDEIDTYLVFDVEAIDSYDQFRLSKEDRINFITLYKWIRMDGANTIEEHGKKLQQAWEEREIQMDGSQGVSLVRVYLHDPDENIRFVGHIGILVEQEDSLLLVEKYGPRAPYLAIKFQNRDEVKQYMLARPDLYGDDTELAPIVMENNTIL